MVVDFSNIDVTEQPLLILQNLDDTPIGVLKFAYNIEVELCYNEVSTLTFELPGYVDGEMTPYYQLVNGMRVIELKNYGRFILVDPQVEDDGVAEIKKCTAYSLEYELTFKKWSLTAGTYNLWNSLATDGTILGIITSLLPSWSVRSVDATLIDRYRTFDDSSDQSVYNFMKSDLQESYGCVFDFDTYNRWIYVRDIVHEPETASVFISQENLVKEVSFEEDTESIFTSLNVYGADGVDIRSVNPMGTTNLINLDYFMTEDNFSAAMIAKYESWKENFASYQLQYFNLTVEEALKTAQLVTETAALATLQGELTSLENIQAVVIQAIAQGLKNQSDLNEVNGDITSKEKEISAKQKEIDSISEDVTSLNEDMVAINTRSKLSYFYTEKEYEIVSRYLKEDSVSEDSFVAISVDAYDDAGESKSLSGSIFNLSQATITKTTSSSGKEIYSASGGELECSINGLQLKASVVRASLDCGDNELLFTARLNDGVLNGDEVVSGTISICGTGFSISSNVKPLDEYGGAISEGTTVSFKVDNGDLYFTRSTTAYEQRAVEWDLFDYGMEFLDRVAYPSYSCELDLVNFLALQEFTSFKNSIALGSRLYWKQRDGKVLQPYLTSVTIPFEDLAGFSVSLSNQYSAKDEEFFYADLIEDASASGHTLDSGKWTYSQFVNSGADTYLSQFMASALDIAKNNIVSSTGQDISWSESGLKLRKRIDGSTAYEPYQIWMNNGTIMFTTDGWDTANLAIGQMVSEDGELISGVIADSLIGKMLAGNSLILESEKKSGGKSVFRVDGSGASLYNATFDVYNGSNTHITINPYSGIAIGKYPLYTDDDYTINEDNAKFWVDTDGNVHIKGTLEGCTGIFSGELKAASGTFAGVVKASDFQDKNGNSMLTSDYKFGADYLELKGLNVNNNFIVDSSGQVTIRGNINMTGGSISWSAINETDSTAYKTANAAAGTANNALAAAYDASDEAYSAANIARKIANGTYTSGTFIKGREIYSPEIYATDFSIIPEKEGDDIGSYSMYGYWGSRLLHLFKIGYYAGDAPLITFGSPCSGYAQWEFTYTTFQGTCDFSGANVTGISATFG